MMVLGGVPNPTPPYPQPPDLPPNPVPVPDVPPKPDLPPDVPPRPQVTNGIASNRIGIIELLCGVILVYFAYSLVLHAMRSPHIHGDDPIDVSAPATSASGAQR
jgi:hypothetical protein